MKKLILLSCLFVSSAVSASGDDAQICNEIADIAATVMQQRQDGVPIETQERIALEFEGDSKDVYELIVEDAYDQLLLNTDLGKQQIVDDFRKHYFELCMNEEK